MTENEMAIILQTNSFIKNQKFTGSSLLDMKFTVSCESKLNIIIFLIMLTWAPAN